MLPFVAHCSPTATLLIHTHPESPSTADAVGTTNTRSALCPATGAFICRLAVIVTARPLVGDGDKEEEDKGGEEEEEEEDGEEEEEEDEDEEVFVGG